jgi:hypothetical protein
MKLFPALFEKESAGLHHNDALDQGFKNHVILSLEQHVAYSSEHEDVSSACCRVCGCVIVGNRVPAFALDLLMPLGCATCDVQTFDGMGAYIDRNSNSAFALRKAGMCLNLSPHFLVLFARTGCMCSVSLLRQTHQLYYMIVIKTQLPHLDSICACSADQI